MNRPHSSYCLKSGLTLRSARTKIQNLFRASDRTRQFGANHPFWHGICDELLDATKTKAPSHSPYARFTILALLTIGPGCTMLSNEPSTVSQWTAVGTARGSAADTAGGHGHPPWEDSTDDRHAAKEDPEATETPPLQETPDVEMRFVAAMPGSERVDGTSRERRSDEPAGRDGHSAACVGKATKSRRDAKPLAAWYEVSGTLNTSESGPLGGANDPTIMATPAVYFDGQPRPEGDQAPRRSGAGGSRVPEEIAVPETDAEPMDESPLVPLTPITRLSVDIRPKGADLPIDHGREMFLSRGMVVYSRDSTGPADLYPVFVASPDFCHFPLYFEQFNLERYGYSHGIAQPFVSAAHFFGRLPAMPYLVAVHRPCQCMATSGPYGPGQYCPCPHVLPPWDFRAALFEAGLVTGLVFIIP